MLLFTENLATKGPNEVITALDYYLKKYKTPKQTKLTIFCDNCFSQNKNRFLFSYLNPLCTASIVKEMEIIYPIPGHSMMPIDWCFALIEKKQAEARKSKHSRIFCKMNRFRKNKKPFDIVFLEHTLFTPGKAIAEEIPVLRVRDFKKCMEQKLNPTFLAYQNVD
ncbi:hypothetical protein ILUMI_25662 [Ignelater luminosus]|uniref:DUF7869 domain-containing protein n=1 Tax=Ignelater luminosus TaxID=2038154 RepID=A0A8K0C583_IGNLU|nr:hypothetical protein ILUMI_25662 [Ignelater luminosus]